jgi:hypothetical protein
MARTYGTSIEEMEALLATASCAICGAEDRELVVDHCHVTGRVRGRLCQNCNRGLGLLGDTLANINRAKEYLSR